jgi:subtilisin family serine protease
MPETREKAQIDLILREFPEGTVDIDPPDWAATSDARFLYRRGSILVRDRDLSRIRDIFGDAANPNSDEYWERVHGGAMNGLTRYQPPPDFRFPGDAPQAPSLTLRYCAYCDWRLGPGVVTPDHLVYVGGVSPCPATEPEESPAGGAPEPSLSRDRCDGDGVKVVVVDVGWSNAPGAPWLAGVTGEAEDAFVPNSQEIKPYAGHGTFIAGIIRCMAPRAEVFVKNAFSRAGATWESELVPTLDEALDLSPDIISLSAGTRTRKDLPLLGIEVFLEQRLSRFKGVALVAAAGNDGDRGPFFPAASPEVISVGALASTWRTRAPFSNHGGWVDVYAPGESLVNAFLTGTFTCQEPPNTNERRSFRGMARWSGTSFSTPLVAGLIAARMSATGENARQAADCLLRFARGKAIPGVGAVLLPGQACADLESPEHNCCRTSCHRT